MDLQRHYLTKDVIDTPVLKERLLLWYKKNKIKYTDKKLNSDAERAQFVVSSILYSLYAKKRPDKITMVPYDHYVKLYSKILHNVIGNNYKVILEFLKDSNIIEIKENMDGKETYRSGVYSKEYRISSNIAKGLTIYRDYQYINKAINKSIEKHFSGIDDIHLHLSEFFKDLHLIDGYNWQERHKPLITYFQSQKNTSYYKVDKSGRSYHKLTNLFSFGRHFLRYKGEPLVSIDCANSQPLLLYNIYKENNILITGDAIEYRDMVISGNFYEYLQDTYIKRSNKQPIERSEFKELIYTYILFSEPMYNHKILEIFKDLFPSITDSIKIIKKTKRREISDRGGNIKDTLSFELRKAESELWINKVAVKIKNYDKNIPIFVLHDSIFTTHKHYDIVLKLIEEVMIDEFGTLPKLHKTFYGNKRSQQYSTDASKYELKRRSTEKRKLTKKEEKKSKYSIDEINKEINNEILKLSSSSYITNQDIFKITKTIKDKISYLPNAP